MKKGGEMSSFDKRILVITSAIDATATYLCEKLVQQGISFIRFNTEAFPALWKLNWEIYPYSTPALSNDSQSIDLKSIGSVWYRRPAPPTISKEVTEPTAREFARQECEETMAAIWQDVDALWVSRPTAIRYASHKPHQLRLAAELGFSVPETLVSSDPDRIRLFWDNHHGSVVFKTLHQDPIEFEGQNYFAYTQRFTAEHWLDSERLVFSPTLFQEYIKPKAEIRVTIIGQKVFAAHLGTLSDEPDWRRLGADEQKWETHMLPTQVENRCVEIVKKCNLSFGAIDLILTHTGEYFFLELNPNGQWAWIEMITGMPLSNALIDLLSSTL